MRNYVSPADGELPRLQPLARLEPVAPVDLDATAAPFARPGVQTVDHRDPITEAQGFLLKYAGLTAILLILAVGLAMRLELRFDVACIVFAVMAGAAYFVLAWGENLYTGPGVERHRLTVGGRVLMTQIAADERIRLAQIRLQRRHLEAQREINAHLIGAAHQRARTLPLPPQEPQNAPGRAQADAWNIADLEPPRFAQEPTDPLTEAILSLYERDDSGEWVHLDDDGYIANGIVVPWAQRGGRPAGERKAMIDVLRRSRFADFDDARRAWRVNLRRYPDAESAVIAIRCVL